MQISLHVISPSKRALEKCKTQSLFFGILSHLLFDGDLAAAFYTEVSTLTKCPCHGLTHPQRWAWGRGVWDASGAMDFKDIMLGQCYGEGTGSAHPPPPEMTCSFPIQLYKICCIVWYVFSAVYISMLLSSQKPSSSYSLLKFVYVTSQLRHWLGVHPFLRKILDPPLISLIQGLETPWLSRRP